MSDKWNPDIPRNPWVVALTDKERRAIVKELREMAEDIHAVQGYNLRSVVMSRAADDIEASMTKGAKS